MMVIENNFFGWQLCKFDFDWSFRVEEIKLLVCCKGVLFKMQSGVDYVIGNFKIEIVLQFLVL